MTTTAAPALTFEGAQAQLARSLPGYTRRPQQEALAGAIEQAITDGSILLAQAGCGTGKSLAALIPAIYSAVSRRQRVVVGTATKALQAQYAATDIPFLEEHLGTDFKWALIKGRSNYLCPAKASALQLKGNVTPGQLAAMEAVEADEEHTGDRDHLPVVSDGEWRDLSMSASECPGKRDCPFGKVCFAERAKTKASGADVVVTNLAYLIQDIRLKQVSGGNVSLLGDYDQLIIDEAHNLPDVVTGALSDTIGQSALDMIARDADGFLFKYEGDGDAAPVVQSTGHLWEGLQLAFSQWVARNRPQPNTPVPFRSGAISSGLYAMLHELMEDLSENLKALGTQVERTLRDIPSDDKEGRSQGARLVRRIFDWALRISTYSTTPATELVKWLEENEITRRGGAKEKRLFLRSAPVDVAPWLTANIWNETPAILMSATLSNGIKNGKPDFSYLEETMGLTSAIEFDAGSPFDYTSQARLFVPARNVPSPEFKTVAAWRVYAQEATKFLVTEAGGGALLLYTSRKAMDEAHRNLAPVFEALGLTVLKQGDMPNGMLKEAFEKDIDSVLFGLRTFMEGIDVKGRSLRLVVLDKLPFAVPTDLLIQARQEAIEAKYGSRSSFSRMTIPTMSLVLIQAFGRAIRDINDRAVIAILDSRLNSKSYGGMIRNSLPPAPVTSDLHEAAAFLNGEEVSS